MSCSEGSLSLYFFCIFLQTPIWYYQAMPKKSFMFPYFFPKISHFYRRKAKLSWFNTFSFLFPPLAFSLFRPVSPFPFISLLSPLLSPCVCLYLSLCFLISFPYSFFHRFLFFLLFNQACKFSLRSKLNPWFGMQIFKADNSVGRVRLA